MQELLMLAINGRGGGGLATCRPLESTVEWWSYAKKTQLTLLLISRFGGFLPFHGRAALN